MLVISPFFGFYLTKLVPFPTLSRHSIGIPRPSSSPQGSRYSPCRAVAIDRPWHANPAVVARYGAVSLSPEFPALAVRRIELSALSMPGQNCKDACR